jgi:hypothetical protein
MKPRHLSLLVPAVLALMFAAGCASDMYNAYKWKTIHLGNDLVDLEVVPEIGGRVLQYSLGDHDFFWVNRELENTRPPASGVGPEGEWLNYGGDKLWPAPQGWDNDAQWPGPPDPVLDGGPYRAQVLSGEVQPTAILLTSREDMRSGIQFTREVKSFEDTTRVHIIATMLNIDTKPRRWSIWAVTQFDVADRHGKGYNKNFWTYCPLNPESRFYRGYGVQYGLVNNPTFNPDPDNGMMRVHYQRIVGKAGLDSPAGWVATVDATDGYAFIHRFTHEPGREYPDGSSVEFWTNGLGDIYAWGKKNPMPEHPSENPYVLESEILGPMASLQPGESTVFEMDWYAAKIPKNSAVEACNDVGIICEPFTAELKNGRFLLHGTFGIFYRGEMGLKLFDRDGGELRLTISKIAVTPLEPVDLSGFRLRTSPMQIPEDAASAALIVYDKIGLVLGELARTPIIR